MADVTAGQDLIDRHIARLVADLFARATAIQTYPKSGGMQITFGGAVEGDDRTAIDVAEHLSMLLDTREETT